MNYIFFLPDTIAYCNKQGHRIEWTKFKTGSDCVTIDGFQFSKWTGSKHKIYWRCSKAQSLGFVALFQKCHFFTIITSQVYILGAEREREVIKVAMRKFSLHQMITIMMNLENAKSKFSDDVKNFFRTSFNRLLTYKPNV